MIKDNKCVMGKYGALVSFSQSESLNNDQLEPEELGRELCQHIVGMNPKEVGEFIEHSEEASRKLDEDSKTLDDNKQDENKEADKNESSSSSSESSDSDSTSSSDEDEKVPKPVIEEHRLLQQEFLLDPDLTVQEFLEENNCGEVGEYVRFQCGEELPDDPES